MAVISGMYGAVRCDGNITSTVTNWTLDDNVNINSYTASNTRGYAGKLPGLKSHSGSFSGLGGVPPVKPGQSFIFRGFTGPDNGVWNSLQGSTYTCKAIASGITINFNYGDYSPINWQVQWTSNYENVGDQLTLGYSGFQDLSLPPVQTMIPSGSCTLKIGNHTGVCLENATLTFNTNIISFANSCTGGYQRGVPGATTATLSATCDASAFDVFGAPWIGKDELVTMYVEGGSVDDVGQTTGDCTTKRRWEFDKMIIGSLTGLNVDIAGGGVVNFTVNMEFNAFPRDNNGVAALGSIRYYNGTAWEGFFPTYEINNHSWSLQDWAYTVANLGAATTGITDVKAFTDALSSSADYAGGIPATTILDGSPTIAGVNYSAFKAWVISAYKLSKQTGESDADFEARKLRTMVGPISPDPI